MKICPGGGCMVGPTGPRPNMDAILIEKLVEPLKYNKIMKS